MEKSITHCSEKCHPHYILHLSVSAVLCWRRSVQLLVRAQVSRLNDSSKKHPPCFCTQCSFSLNLLKFCFFNQVEINSPRDKYWSLQSQECNWVIWPAACTFRATHSVCLEIQQSEGFVCSVHAVRMWICYLFCKLMTIQYIKSIN